MSLGKLFRRTVAAVAVLIVLAIVVVRVTFYYLTAGYCARLVEHARDPAVQRELESWAAVNWSGARVPLESIEDDDGIGPGIRWRPARFDGSLLGVGPTAHVRLLGVGPRDVLDDRISEHVAAVYFAERSRYGVAVKVAGGDRFGLEPTAPFKLVEISDTIAVICEE